MTSWLENELRFVTFAFCTRTVNTPRVKKQNKCLLDKTKIFCLELFLILYLKNWQIVGAMNNPEGKY